MNIFLRWMGIASGILSAVATHNAVLEESAVFASVAVLMGLAAIIFFIDSSDYYKIT